MQERIKGELEPEVYYVPGSELIPVHTAGLREILKLRQKDHEDSVKRALLQARSFEVA